MAYPQYDITFQSTGELKVKEKSTGKVGSIHTDGSHTLVLDVNGTQVTVALTHEDAGERTPKLVLTFS